MSDDENNVTRLGVGFKRPPQDDEPMLKIHHGLVGKCLEHNYVIDPESDIVTCSKCDKTFNPMHVLVELAKRESRWRSNHARYADEMKRLSERERTKCQHCGRITKISRR